MKSPFEIKKDICDVGHKLWLKGFVAANDGNISVKLSDNEYYCTPTGVSKGSLTPDMIIKVDKNGNKLEGKLNPSSDLPTHIELYKAFPEIGGITHTHSRWATIFAQAGKSVKALGTTHADTFYGDVPCTRRLTPQEITGEYEKETGTVIIEAFKGIDPLSIPAVLVNSHGPFTWGANAAKSVENAIILEETAMMAWHTMKLNENTEIQQELLGKHYLRKHGKNAYYGQKEKQNGN